MPFATPEKKLKRSREWRRSRTPAYYKWLYERRKLRFDAAVAYKQVLAAIAAGSAGAMDAGDVIEEFERRERKLGNHFDHEDNRGVWVVE